MSPYLVVLGLVIAFTAACSSKDPAPLSPAFAELARIEALSDRGSTRLERARELLAPHAQTIDELARGAEAERVALTALDPEVAQALALAMEARDSGDTPTFERCRSRNLHEYRRLAKALVVTAPEGDRAQLGAALWLAHRIEAGAPGLIATMVAVDIGDQVVSRLAVDKTAPTEGLRRLTWPRDLVRASFAREVLCTMERIDEALAAGDAQDPRVDLLGGQRQALVDFYNDVVARIVALGDRPNDVVAVLERELGRAAGSEVELIKTVATIPRLYRELEAKRQAVAGYLEGTPAAAASEVTPVVSAAVSDGDGALAGRQALDALRVSDGARGLRVLGVTPEHAWRGLGIDNGDVITLLDQRPLASDGLAERFAELGPGRHTLVVERSGEPVELAFEIPARPAADEIAPAAALEVVDARAQELVRRRVTNEAERRRAELRAGLETAWNASHRGYVIGGVRPGGPGDELGLDNGDVLLAIGGMTAETFAADGRGGIDFITYGIKQRDVDVEFIRGGAVMRMRWRFE